jgi:hypothetical protein
MESAYKNTVYMESAVNLSSDGAVEAAIGRQTKSVFLIYNPFVGLEGGLEFTLPTPYGAGEFRGLGVVDKVCSATFHSGPSTVLTDGVTMSGNVRSSTRPHGKAYP